MNRRIAIRTALVTVTVWLTLAVVVLISRRTTVGAGPGSAAAITRLSLAVLIVGTVQGACLFAALVATGLLDRAEGRPVSRLYLPVVVLAGFLFAYTSLASASSLDLLLHDLRFRWVAFREPEVRVFGNLLLIGVFGSLGWFLAVVLRGRGWSRRAVAGVYAGISALAAALIVAPAIVR